MNQIKTVSGIKIMARINSGLLQAGDLTHASHFQNVAHTLNLSSAGWF